MKTDVPSLRARWLGTKLAEMRHHAGLKSLAAAAEKTGRSTASLSRIENGVVYLPPRDLPPILDAYGVTDQRLREKLMIAAVEVQQERRGWWVDHGDVLSPSYLDLIRLEATATEIQTYETHFIPGLLQTEAYARTVPMARQPIRAEELDQFVAVRMTRRIVLTGADPICFRVVVSEAVLRHAIGGPEIFRDQLTYLRECGDWQNVTVQILPFTSRPHPGMTGAFTLLRLPSLDVAHVEMLNSDAYVENERNVDQYLWAFARLSEMALDPVESSEFIADVIDTL